MDQVNTAAWIGRTLCDEGGIDAVAAAKLHATVGAVKDTAPKPGTGPRSLR